MFLIFLAAVFARVTDLSTHFSTYDDLSPAHLVLKTSGSGPVGTSIYIGSQTSYAPLQFALTSLLLKDDMDYRATLFWGRFPSFMFSLLTIAFFIWFLSRYFDEVRRNHSPLYQALIALGAIMLSFSWEHVIYSKFMGAYAIGPFFLVLFLFQLLLLSQKTTYTNRYLLFPLGLALLGALAQYQLLLFLPGLGLATAWLVYRNLHANHEKLRATGTLASGFALFTVFFYFLWNKFLKQNSGNIAGEKGLDGMFLLNLQGYDGILAKLGRVAEYFPLNFGRLIGSNLSYTFEETPLSYLIWSLCFFFILTGFIKMWSEPRDPARRSFAIFITVSAIVWAVLIIQGKMALSPTRHHMILIPIMILLTLEGVFLLVQVLWLARIWSTRAMAPAVFGLLIFVSFAMSFPKMTKDRRDVFNETELSEIFRNYQVGVVYQAPNLLNLHFMKDLSKNFPVVSGIWLGISSQRSSYDTDTLAYVSQGEGMTDESFETFVKRFNETSGGPVWVGQLSDYEIVYQKEEAGISMEYSKYSTREKNDFKLYILKKKSVIGPITSM
jgi:hypothetical protein